MEPSLYRRPQMMGPRLTGSHFSAEADEISADIDAYELMRGIGSLCVGADNDPRYDARRMVELLIAGLLQSRST